MTRRPRYRRRCVDCDAVLRREELLALGDLCVPCGEKRLEASKAKRGHPNPTPAATTRPRSSIYEG